MPRLSKREQSVTIGILQAGCMFLTSRDIIFVIRQLYRSSEIITRLLGQ